MNVFSIENNKNLYILQTFAGYIFDAKNIFDPKNIFDQMII